MQSKSIPPIISGKCKTRDKTMQSDDIAAIIGADSEKARERAYWEVFQNMRFIYGSCAFEDQNFDDFVTWLDSLFEPQP